ncbi:MAG: DMT family transporter [Phyllobacterium sp.]
MSTSDFDHRKGLLITGIGGLALSFDIPLLRLGQGETWSVLLLRSGTTFLTALVIWLVWSLWSGRARAALPGRQGLLVAGLYGLSSITFMIAVFSTSTANLVFILTFNTVFAALLSWIFLKERPKSATLVAIAFMILGVAIIVKDGFQSGNWFGDAFALVSTFILASAITVTRASGKNMGFAPLLGTLVPTLVAASFVAGNGFTVEHPGWIIFNGAFITTTAFMCLATGPKYLSGPEVAMFYLLETVLAPIYVWLIFAETPTRAAFTGGFILITTLIIHSFWQMRARRKRLTQLQQV